MSKTGHKEQRRSDVFESNNWSCWTIYGHERCCVRDEWKNGWTPRRWTVSVCILTARSVPIRGNQFGCHWNAPIEWDKYSCKYCTCTETEKNSLFSIAPTNPHKVIEIRCAHNSRLAVVALCRIPLASRKWVWQIKAELNPFSPLFPLLVFAPYWWRACTCGDTSGAKRRKKDKFIENGGEKLNGEIGALSQLKSRHRGRGTPISARLKAAREWLFKFALKRKYCAPRLKCLRRARRKEPNK